VEADLGIDQGLLCGGDSIDGQLSLNGCAALDQTQSNGAELEVPCRAADEAD
jgi:hypothetical protein